MKWKHPVSLMVTLVVAVFVAAAMAQQPNPTEEGTTRKDVSQPISRSSTVITSSTAPVTDMVQDPFRGDYVQDQPAGGTSVGYGFGQGRSFAAPGAWTTSGSGFGGESSALANEASVLIRKLAAADSDAKRGAIKTQLRDNLGKQFDARQKRHDQEIKALEDKVKKLKELVIKRQESRDEIISRRLEQVLRDSEGLGW